MSSILIFIIILGVIVFVHEFGHFIMAKRAGMDVEEFGFGFPPRIFGVKKGATLYSVNWIPLGGFVKIKGENDNGQHDAGSFSSKKLPARIAVVVAGVIMNVILAFVLITGGYLFGMPQALDSLPAGAIVSNSTVRITGILAGSPADKGGIVAGDIVIESAGEPVTSSDAFRNTIKSGTGELSVTVKRGKETKTLKLQPEILKETGNRGIGIELADIGTVRFPWYLAPVKGAEAVFNGLVMVAVSFWQLVSGLVVGRGLPADVSGPVGIAVYTGQAAKIGFAYLVEFTALLSLNLAVLNIIPFPALDGGRLLFLIIEALRGRSVSRKIEGIAHQAGFGLLMILILAVTYRDLVRYGGAIGGFIKGLF